MDPSGRANEDNSIPKPPVCFGSFRRKPPTPKESKLHVATAKLLDDYCLPDWRWTFLNRKAKDAREGAIFKRMGLKPDWPDFILISPIGEVHFLELKRPGKKQLRPGQSEFYNWCCDIDIPYVVADTIGEVVEILNFWGCGRVRLS